MADKQYLDSDGVKYLWDKAAEIYMKQEDVEALSSYDIDIITGMPSSAEALVTLLSNGGPIQLADNITLPETVTIDKNVILDLNGYTITALFDSYAFVATGTKLTIIGGGINASHRIAQAINGGEIIVKSGVFTAGNMGIIAEGSGSKITFDGGILTTNKGSLGAFDGASIEINGGSIKGLDNFSLFTNGTEGRGNNTVIINNGYLEGNIVSDGYESCAVYIANNDTFIMNNGTIKSTDGCGILMRAGNITINGGTVIAEKKSEDSHSPGFVGNAEIPMSASAVIYHESANYPGKDGMSLTINDGEFTGADHSLEIISNEAEPNVTVTGGTFVPDFPEGG